MEDRIYTLGFSAFSGIGTIRYEKLLAALGTAEKAWNAPRSDLNSVLGILGEKFDEFRKTFNPQKYAEEIEKKEIQWLVPADKDYPKLLKQLNTVILGSGATPGSDSGQARMTDGSRVKSMMTRAPFILFAKGNIAALSSQKIIGIVGTRKITSYGIQVTEMLTRDLVTYGFTIVSGMAFGVDAVAHRETIKNNGVTIAVLGSGVDVPTPREHAGLYREILQNNGAIVSTFSPGEVPQKGSFPARNATIAGLSLGIVVTEGAEDSGALITASDAASLQRPVFSVPGQITSSLSKGTNNLIKKGAIAISTVSDIIEHLGIKTSPQPSPRKAREIKGKFSAEEQKIISLLGNGPLLFDEIVRTMGKDSKEIGSLLSLMELKGIVKNSTDGKYMLQ